MPNKETILEYWNQSGQLCMTIKEEWGAAQGECFACGDCNNLERCHIIPICYGGSNNVDNIHLLCRACHLESEGIKVYWTWFEWKRKNVWNYGINHLYRKFKMYGYDIPQLTKDITSDVNFDYDSFDKEAFVKNIFKEVYW